MIHTSVHVNLPVPQPGLLMHRVVSSNFMEQVFEMFEWLTFSFPSLISQSNSSGTSPLVNHVHS